MNPDYAVASSGRLDATEGEFVASRLIKFIFEMNYIINLNI